jgi:hypothetical protein
MPEPLPIPHDLGPAVLDAFALAIADLERKIGEPRVYRVLPDDVDELRAQLEELEDARERLRSAWNLN